MNYEEWWRTIEIPCKYPVVRDQGSARCPHPSHKGTFEWCDMAKCPELMKK
jgi:hypothetical protein